MLTLASNAISVIRRATSNTDHPDEAGVRIAPSPADGQLTIEIVAAPSPGDQVLDAEGARVFLDSGITGYVEELELYALVQSGKVHLAFRNPIPAAPA
jgi:Fe-S cluster assembly iron-binding protein IscA